MVRELGVVLLAPSRQVAHAGTVVRLDIREAEVDYAAQRCRPRPHERATDAGEVQ